MTRVLFLSCSHQSHVKKKSFRVLFCNHTLLKSCKQGDGPPGNQSRVTSTEPTDRQTDRQRTDRTHHTLHSDTHQKPPGSAFLCHSCSKNIHPIGQCPGSWPCSSGAQPWPERQSSACPVQTSWGNGHTGT